jgi:ABC-type nitrate/sulfonate/bicarbonate transport system substrate-binding protein
MNWKQYLVLLLAMGLPLAGYAQNASTVKPMDLKVITGHYHAGHRIMTKIANEKGWFREEGLGRIDISPLGTNDDHLTLAELAKGTADIVWDPHSDIVVQEDAKGLNTIHDLKGTRVGVNEIDGMDAWEVRKGWSWRAWIPTATWCGFREWSGNTPRDRRCRFCSAVTCTR